MVALIIQVSLLPFYGHSKTIDIMPAIYGLSYLILITTFFITFHLKIGLAFISGNRNRKYLYSLPIILFSLTLMYLKINTNEFPTYFGFSINYPNEYQRLFNYLTYSLWTSIFLWEMYFILVSNFFQKRLKIS